MIGFRVHKYKGPAKNEALELLSESLSTLNLSSSAQSKPRETVGRRATGLSKSGEPAEPPEEKSGGFFFGCV
jgi:hypothetical protein